MGGMGPGAGAGDPQAMDALQAHVAPQLIEAVQGGITAHELGDLLFIPEDQAAALIRVVREGEMMLSAPCLLKHNTSKSGW